MMGVEIIAGATVAAIAVLVIIFKSMWRVAEPNEALIISGLKAGGPDEAGLGFRVVTGRGTFVMPGLQTVRRLTLDINEAALSVNCVTKQGIEVGVRGVVIFKVGDDEASISNSARRFLDQQDGMVSRIVNVFEGHLRSIIGSLTMEELVRERERLTQETALAAGVELAKLGLVIDTLQIKDLEDPTGYIANMAKPYKATIEKEARIAQAQANQEATQAEAKARALQAESVRTSEISQAQFQAEIDQAKAKADQAGPLAQAAARQQVVVQETEVVKLEAARREQQLEVEVRRPADAARYRVEQEAQAARTAVIAEAQADRERRQLAAAALQAEGEAQAAAIQVTGEAEAAAIRAKGFAEAASIERRAQALASNSEAVVLQEIAESYPEIVAAAAQAFSNVGSLQVLNGADGVNEMLMSIVGQGLAGFSVVKNMISASQGTEGPAPAPSTTDPAAPGKA